MHVSPATSSSSSLTLPEPPAGYTLWAVLARPNVFMVKSDPWPPGAGVGELARIISTIQSEGVTLRGFYDVSGFRADADLMIWIHESSPAALQRALRALRRTTLLRHLLPVWNAMGLHRDAEFTRTHVPAFLRGIKPADWITVYPFVRSYEWYVLPEDERRAMLAEHGRAGAPYRSVLTNTVAGFALGDYEWILPLEADRLSDLVDMMRDLRATGARRHVREETPFYTGRRLAVDEIPDVIR